ncbi:MAG: NAD(P)-binding domain-containing protein [Acidobacteria bacterium]|nr:NAD(P)-binding domain-containing protein [Acidobacteriota bacterium]
MNDLRLYAVLGQPVLHSRSPNLFNAAFQANQIPAHYTRLLAPTAAAGLRLATDVGFRGLNVTTPFKEAIMQSLDRVDLTARRIGAVNTLLRNGRRWAGFNTDWIGATGALTRHGVPIAGRTALVLGAGGAGRAAVHGLLAAGAREVWLANRTASRAREWAARLGSRWCTLAEAAARAAGVDIVVDCISDDRAAAEIVHSVTGDALLRAAYRRGTTAAPPASTVKQVDGLAWLLHQALPAYELFEMQPAERETMAAALLQPPPGGEAHSPRNIALIGFMGAGKTAVGRELSQRLGFTLADLDAMIESRDGRPIPQIFAEGGEAEFRRRENAALADAVAGSRQVIACGGGVVGSAANRDLLGRRTVVVWLWAPLETCLRRVAGTPRPLLAVSDPMSAAQRLAAERHAAYAATARLVVGTDETGPAEVAAQLAAEFRNLWT